MAQKYTPIWDDWLKVTRELTPAEKGRLIDAIVAYDNGGDWQEIISGNERYVFPGYQVRLDLWKELSETRAKSAKGNKSEQTDTNNSKTEQNQTKDSNFPKVKVKEKVKDINNDTAHAREESSIGTVTVDPLIVKTQQELNGLTDTHYAALNDYRDTLSDDVVSYAIDLAVGNGVRNWSYVEVILRGWLKAGVKTLGEAKAENEKHRQQPRQQPKLLRSQQYEQRDWKESEMAEKLGVDDLFKVGAG